MRRARRSSLPELTSASPLRNSTGKTHGMRFSNKPPRNARPEVRASSEKESGSAETGAGLDEGCAAEVAAEGAAAGPEGAVAETGAEDAVAGAVPTGGSAAIS